MAIRVCSSIQELHSSGFGPPVEQISQPDRECLRGGRVRQDGTVKVVSQVGSVEDPTGHQLASIQGNE